MNIKIIFFIFLLVIFTGCVTQNSFLKPAREDVTVDLRKPLQSKASNLWWLITLNDNRSVVECWVVRDDSLIFVQDSSAILFKDPETGEKIMLTQNYSLTIVRMGSWHHYDYLKQTSGKNSLLNEI